MALYSSVFFIFSKFSPYEVSKLCCEKYIEFYYRVYGLLITSPRYFTVFSPR